MKLFLSAIITLALFSNAKAHDEKLGYIKGEHLNLIYADHALSGSIADMPIYASPDKTKPLGLKLIHRSQDKDHETIFEMVDGEYKGTLKTPNGNGFTEVSIIGEALSSEGRFFGKLNGKSFSVQVSSETMDDYHYVDPTFVVTYGKKSYTFKLEGGSACMGCATKISSVILTMLVASGKI